MASHASILEKDKKQAVSSDALIKRGSSVQGTGVPQYMKKKLEDSSGVSLEDVRIHYRSEKPAQLLASAYTQQNHVYIGPGQEKHLAHELGHVVQQKLGQVRPTGTVENRPVNDDPVLEKAADHISAAGYGRNMGIPYSGPPVIQRKLMGVEEFRRLTDRIAPGRNAEGKKNTQYYKRLDRMLHTYHTDRLRKDAKIQLLHQIMEELELWQEEKPRSARGQIRNLLYRQAAGDISEMLLGGGKYYEEVKLEEKLEKWAAVSGAPEIEGEEAPLRDALLDKHRELYKGGVTLEFGSASSHMEKHSGFEEILDKLLFGCPPEEYGNMESVFQDCINRLIPFSTIKGVQKIISGASNYGGMNAHLVMERDEKKPEKHHLTMLAVLKRFKLMTDFMEEIANKIIPSSVGTRPMRYRDRYYLESTGSDPHVGGKHAVFLYEKEGYQPESMPAGVYKAHDMASDSKTEGRRKPGKERTGVLSLMSTLLKAESFARFKQANLAACPLLKDLTFPEIGFAFLDISEEDSMAGFAHKKKDMSKQEADSYDFNMGMLQMVAKTYNMLDLHQDNIMPVSIGRGCAPLIVDGEVSFLQRGIFSGLQEASTKTGDSVNVFKVDGIPHICNPELLRYGYLFFREVMSGNIKMLQDSVKEQMTGLVRIRILPYATADLMELLANYLSIVSGGRDRVKIDEYVNKMVTEGKILYSDKTVKELGNIIDNLKKNYFYGKAQLEFNETNYRKLMVKALEAGTYPAFEFWMPDDSISQAGYVLLDAPPGKIIPEECVIATVSPHQGMSMREMLVLVRKNMIKAAVEEKPGTRDEVFRPVPTQKSVGGAERFLNSSKGQKLKRSTSQQALMPVGDKHVPRLSDDMARSVSDEGELMDVIKGADAVKAADKAPGTKPVKTADGENAPGTVKKPELAKAPEGRKGLSMKNTQGARLFRNSTEGDGNCFFHALHEAMNENRSTEEAQAVIRAAIIDKILNDPVIMSDFFGTVRDGIDEEYVNTFLDTLIRGGEWVPDHSPYMIARTFSINIVILRPDGTIYSFIDIGAGRTVWLEYTGNHYNSYTRRPL